MTVYQVFADGSTYFGVQHPGIRYTKSQHRGQYRPRSSEIRLPRNPDAGYQQYVAVHEMAHHVDYCLNPNRAGRRPHDKRFFNILVDLVQLCYDRVQDYPWDREYATIRWWASNKGYCTPPLNGRLALWGSPSRERGR